ncbi:unnamed protein product, partial [Prorocentrum cordatum]
PDPARHYSTEDQALDHEALRLVWDLQRVPVSARGERGAAADQAADDGDAQQGWEDDEETDSEEPSDDEQGRDCTSVTSVTQGGAKLGRGLSLVLNSRPVKPHRRSRQRARTHPRARRPPRRSQPARGDRGDRHRGRGQRPAAAVSMPSLTAHLLAEPTGAGYRGDGRRDHPEEDARPLLARRSSKSLAERSRRGPAGLLRDPAGPLRGDAGEVAARRPAAHGRPNHRAPPPVGGPAHLR